MNTLGKAVQLLSLVLLLQFAALNGIRAQQSYRYEIGFKNDNDVYLLTRQDQYYTNGVQLYFRKALESMTADQQPNVVLELSLGQNLYNSYTAQIDRKEEVDRPITGYLFANAGIKRFYQNGSILHVGAELGLIGPAAFGKPIQQSFHHTFGLYPTSGWEYQLRSALGLDLQAGYQQNLTGAQSSSFDIAMQYEGSLGLNHTNLSAAPVFRLGSINPWYQSASSNSRINTGSHAVKRELFLFYSPQVNFVLYDATIQGGIFRRDKGPVSGRPERWVLSQQVGVIYAKQRVTLNLHYIFNTRETSTMYYRHQYGSISVFYRF